ncbi:hypothetical protein NM208_g7826 [Fusarium decemcellulare]|uniref:Uncharacterized protein n=1 Tax=Fusarium decemcellulare TaxID=57161 RepID=A0ACC1S7P6_9HYPO|nr:hypothetical protein NM208_g7826 [Fusarium decemcellulare]
MPLCPACVSIRFEDLLTGSCMPWKRTTSDVQASSKSCELCALIISASDNEWLPNKMLRDLTVPEDKLPAISGVASVFGSRRQDAYLAGLWEGDIQIGLLWHSENRKGLKRPSKFRAPSWSWAAYDGPIETAYDWDGEVVLDITASCTTLANKDSYGKVISGFIEGSGFLQQISKASPVTRAELKFGWDDANTQLLNLQGTVIGEASLDTPEAMSKTDELFCLMIFRVGIGFRPLSRQILNNMGDWAWGLLLERAGAQFRRVGLAKVHQSFFEGAKEKLTII